MVKAFFALPLLFTPLLLNGEVSSKNSSFDVQTNERGNYTVTGVKDFAIDNEELKIYYDQDNVIDEISDDAFVTCTNLNTLVLSYSITHINNAALIDSIDTIKYTGSQDQFDALNLTKEGIDVYTYASDEGFINFWNTYIRPEADSNICQITREIYNATYARYTDLSVSEREIVDAATDIANEKIGLSMVALINYFKGNPQPSNKGTTWNQKGAISFIIVVAVIGMTSICVFYLMKAKQIID